MMNILIGAGIIVLAIELLHQRSLVKYYKQKYYDILGEYNDTADELHHLKIKYNLIPIPCWEM